MKSYWIECEPLGVIPPLEDLRIMYLRLEFALEHHEMRLLLSAGNFTLLAVRVDSSLCNLELSLWCKNCTDEVYDSEYAP